MKKLKSSTFYISSLFSFSAETFLSSVPLALINIDFNYFALYLFRHKLRNVLQEHLHTEEKIKTQNFSLPRHDFLLRVVQMRIAYFSFFFSIYISYIFFTYIFSYLYFRLFFFFLLHSLSLSLLFTLFFFYFSIFFSGFLIHFNVKARDHIFS